MPQPAIPQTSCHQSNIIKESRVSPVFMLGIIFITFPILGLLLLKAVSSKVTIWSPPVIFGFAAWGLAVIHLLVAMARRVVLRLSRGSRFLEVKGMSLEQGASTQVLLKASRLPEQVTLLRCTLSCNEDFNMDGEGDSPTSIRWRYPWCVPLSNRGRSRTGWQLPLALTIPSDLPATKTSGSTWIRWELDVQAVSPSVNDRSTFTIPVGSITAPERTLLSASLPEDELPQPALRAVLALQVADFKATLAEDGFVVVNPLGEGIEPTSIHFHAATNSLAFVLLFADMMIAYNHDIALGPILMVGLFALVSLIFLIGVLVSAVTINRTSITASGIHRERGIIRPKTKWFLTPKDIKSIDIAPEESSLGTRQWRLMLTQANGHTEPLTKAVGPEQEAFRIASAMCLVVGLPGCVRKWDSGHRP